MSQEFVDSMPDDGMISSAYKVQSHMLVDMLTPDGQAMQVETNQPNCRGIRPNLSYPAPQTPQYLDRANARQLEQFNQYVNHELIEGYVQAHYDADPDSA